MAQPTMVGNISLYEEIEKWFGDYHSGGRERYEKWLEDRAKELCQKRRIIPEDVVNYRTGDSNFWSYRDESNLDIAKREISDFLEEELRKRDIRSVLHLNLGPWEWVRGVKASMIDSRY